MNFPLGVLIPIGVVVILGVVLWLVSMQVQRKRAALVERGKALQAAQDQAVWAGAEVVSVSTLSGYADSSRVILRVMMMVSGASDKPYPATVEWLVDLAILMQIQPGAHLSVKVDAEDPRAVYPNMSGVRYLGKG